MFPIFARGRLSRRTLLRVIGGEIPTVRVFDKIDSTNTEAKRLAAKGVAMPALIVANRQTAGRGRMGRSFFSPKGTGVYFSILAHTTAPLEQSLAITSAASVALVRAINRLYGLQTEIKWVNDLYFRGKKVAGILTEAVTSGGQSHLIVGIGINLSTANFPPALSEIAGSLALPTDQRESLIAAIWQELKPYLNDPRDPSWIEDYRAHSCVLGKRVTWSRDGACMEGVAEDINCRGGLLIRMESGEQTCLQTGEISVRLV